jgi:hypothetical protein
MNSATRSTPRLGRAVRPCAFVPLVARSEPFARLLLALALGIAIPGCAFGNRNVTLKYPPASELQTSPPPKPLPVPAVEMPSVAVVVNDTRQGPRNQVGVVRNGFGMHTADILTQDDAAAWVKEALERELAAQGFRVVAVEGAESVLRSQVVKIECGVFGSGAELMLAAEFTAGGSHLPYAAYSGTGTAGGSLGASEEYFSESLSLALQTAARKIAALVKWALQPPGTPPPVFALPTS